MASSREPRSSNTVRVDKMQSSASAPAPAAAPPADVPRKLATDLYLGELASAANEELLRALGISHILVLSLIHI